MRSVPFASPAVTVPRGTGDVEAISLPAREARGIIVNNPSGSWLTVYPLHDDVPPYTLLWSRDFPMSVANATVRYDNGPAGQVSTQDGDPFTVWLDTDPVGTSDGTPAPGKPFVQGFTPVLNFADLDRLVQAASGGTGLVGLVPGVAGVRYRLLTLTPTLQFGTSSTQSASNVYFRMSNSGGRPPQRVLLTPRVPVVPLIFPLGLDYPAGGSIDYSAITNYADQLITVTGTYQVL